MIGLYLALESDTERSIDSTKKIQETTTLEWGEESISILMNFPIYNSSWVEGVLAWLWPLSEENAFSWNGGILKEECPPWLALLAISNATSQEAKLLSDDWEETGLPGRKDGPKGGVSALGVCSTKFI